MLKILSFTTFNFLWRSMLANHGYFHQRAPKDVPCFRQRTAHRPHMCRVWAHVPGLHWNVPGVQCSCTTGFVHPTVWHIYCPKNDFIQLRNFGRNLATTSMIWGIFIYNFQNMQLLARTAKKETTSCNSNFSRTQLCQMQLEICLVTTLGCVGQLNFGTFTTLTRCNFSIIQLGWRVQPYLLQLHWWQP